jgi:hypothetical protein
MKSTQKVSRSRRGREAAVRRAGGGRRFVDERDEEEGAGTRSDESKGHSDPDEVTKSSEPWEDIRLGFPIQSLPRKKVE